MELKEKPHLAGSEAHKHTLADAIGRYGRDVLPHMSATAQRDRPPILQWWADNYGRMTLATFQAPTIVEARDRLARTPKQRGEGTLAPATVNKHLLFLSHLLSTAAKEWHWIAASPMDGVRLLKVNNARTRFLSDEGEDSELARLLEAASISESPHLHAFILLTLVTAGRRSEVLGLTWDRVDMAAGTVTFADTKNGDTRTVAISPEVVDLLKPRQGIGRALLFPSPGNPRKPVDIRSAWETALRRAGIEDFTIHGLRHTAASYAAMEGATSAELAGILGHRTLAMVKRYSHLSPSHVARASAKIGARIGRNGGRHHG